MKVSPDKLQSLADRVLKCRTRRDALVIGAELALLFTAGGFKPYYLGQQFAEAMCEVSDAAWKARQAAKTTA